MFSRGCIIHPPREVGFIKVGVCYCWRSWWVPILCIDLEVKSWAPSMTKWEHLEKGRAGAMGSRVGED